MKNPCFLEGKESFCYLIFNIIWCFLNTYNVILHFNIIQIVHAFPSRLEENFPLVDEISLDKVVKPIKGIYKINLSIQEAPWHLSHNLPFGLRVSWLIASLLETRIGSLPTQFRHLALKCQLLINWKNLNQCSSPCISESNGVIAGGIKPENKYTMNIIQKASYKIPFNWDSSQFLVLLIFIQRYTRSCIVQNIIIKLTLEGTQLLRSSKELKITQIPNTFRKCDYTNYKYPLQITPWDLQIAHQLVQLVLFNREKRKIFRDLM